MTKTRFAVIIAALFAVPAGVVALEQATSISTVEVSEPVRSEPVAEQAPAEYATVTTVTTVEPAIVVEERVRSSMNIQSAAAPNHNDEPGNVLLPSQIAYLDGLQAQRGQLIAMGDAFPASHSLDDQAPLPMQVAYFDRGETRIAAVSSRQVARIDGTPVVVGSSEAVVVAEASPAR